jgi:rhomboid family GlyGly-CTERM serine protease
MGLGKRHDSAPSYRVLQGGHWFFPLAILLVCGLIGVFGDAGRDLLKYDRLAIADGQFWRLLTGHLTHLGLSHLALNMAGLLLVWLLVGRYYRPGEWLVIFLMSAGVASAGFWYLSRNMLWYVGLSGVLHGLIIAGAIRGLRQLPGESAVILAAVIGKLTWEQLAGPLPGSESVSGGNVIVNAHLYGAIGGAIAAGGLWRGARQPASI